MKYNQTISHLFYILWVGLQDAGAGELALVLVDVPQPDGLVATAWSNESTCNVKEGPR